ALTAPDAAHLRPEAPAPAQPRTGPIVVPRAQQALGRLQVAQCVVPQGTKPDPQLKRWYGYKVSTTAHFNEPTTWSWQKPNHGSVFAPPPPANVPNGASEFVVWMPAGTGGFGYSGELKATASPKAGTPNFQAE